MHPNKGTKRGRANDDDNNNNSSGPTTQFALLLHLHAAAEQGNSNAQFLLGDLLERGGCCSGDDLPHNSLAVADFRQWYRKAAEQGHAEAAYRLGDRCHQREQRLEYFLNAATLGHKTAFRRLGITGNCATVTVSKNKHTFREAAYNDSPNALYYYAQMVDDSQSSLNIYCAAALQGHAEARICLSNLYEKSRDPLKAVRWCRAAAKQGNADAMVRFGNMFMEGLGVARDPGSAVVWFRCAAEQGHPLGQYHLGRMFDEGNAGVEQDYALAAKWYTAAANQGNPRARCSLGTLYENGHGVGKKDLVAALHCYSAAAAQGDAEAQCNYAMLLVNGEGVERNYDEALRWFRAAAAQGYESAKYYLRFMQ